MAGGVSGIGAATAELLKSSGYTVIANYFGNDADITRDNMLHKMTAEQWRSVIDVDLGGCFNTCRAVIESMRERRFGRIVNISFVNGLSGQFGQTNYSAAKAGIIGFTKALALEGASRGTTVNEIAPGYTDTGMVRAVPAKVLEGIVAAVPVGRLAKPEEIAGDPVSGGGGCRLHHRSDAIDQWRKILGLIYTH